MRCPNNQEKEHDRREHDRHDPFDAFDERNSAIFRFRCHRATSAINPDASEIPPSWAAPKHSPEPVLPFPFDSRAALRILSLERDRERMQLRRHYPGGNRRIALHEFARGCFIFRFKDGYPKSLVARFRSATGQN